MYNYLGIDLGTESARVSIYDKAGFEIATNSVALKTIFPGSGMAEQNPLEWWKAICEATRFCISQLNGPKIVGIGLATTSSTVIACKKDGTPLRNAILWMDTRAWKESKETSSVKHPIMRFSGGYDAAEWLVPKALWISKNEKEIYRDSDFIVEAIDYLVFKLTGTWVASMMNATCKSNYDSQNKEYVHEIYETLGLPDLTTKFPQKVVPVGEVISNLTNQAALELGIVGNPVVAQGGIDAHLAMLASGKPIPNHVFMIAGTSNVMISLTKKEHPVPGIWGPYPNALMEGLWLLEGGQISAGSILRWTVNKLLGLSDDASGKLINDCVKLDPRSNSLLVLDYWMGNRSPYRDDNLRGAILGLSLNHEPIDIYRAAVESVCFGSLNVISTLRENGIEIDSLTLSGGIARNPFWLQSTVDVFGFPIDFSDATNMTTLAGAICAAKASNHYPDLLSASESLKVKTQKLEPNLKYRDYYLEKFQQYLETTKILTPTFHELTARESIV